MPSKGNRISLLLLVLTRGGGAFSLNISPSGFFAREHERLGTLAGQSPSASCRPHIMRLQTNPGLSIEFGSTSDRTRRQYLTASLQLGAWQQCRLSTCWQIEIVRHLFDRYLVLKSVRNLADEAARDGLSAASAGRGALSDEPHVWHP
jgi:hypothetical protein